MVSLWDNVERNCIAWQATDDNMAHAHCMLDTEGYKHTLRICSIYFFSTATMVARTPLMLRNTFIACVGRAKIDDVYPNPWLIN